ncbi:MAG: oligosaccharide flippase family protein [Pseudomonadota bacterium]
MKLGRHLLGYAPVKLIVALVAFGGIYVFTRLLTPEQYGRYALMLAALSLIHALSLTWVEASMFRFTGKAVARGNTPDHYKTALVSIFYATIAAMALSGLLLLIVWPYPGYRWFVPLIALHLPFNSIVKTVFEARRASQQVRHYTLASVSKTVLGFIVGVALAWQAGLGALSPIAGLLAASTVLMLIEGPWLLKQAAGGKSDPQQRRAWLGFGIPTAIAISLDMLLSSADRFLIAVFIDEAAVGAYTAGYGVADKTVLVICAWAALAASPLMMEAYERNGAKAASKEAKGLINTLLLLGAPAATGLALVAKPLAEAMIGEGLRDQAIEIIPWIAFAGLLNGLLIHYVSESFQLAHKTRQRALLMAVPVLANVALNCLMIPTFGLMGAVYATLISYAGALILMALVGRNYLALPVPLKDAGLVALACLAMWPVIALVPEFGSWLELFLKAGIGAATYVAIILSLNAGNSRHMLKALLARRAPA